jgi:hypothetical protein
MICPTGEAKYFCKGDWTGFSTARPSGKSLGNPLSRFDADTNMSETFAYDRLNRLTSATHGWSATGDCTINAISQIIKYAVTAIRAV